MNRPQYLAHRIREVFLNGKWIAFTNYKELIESTSWKEAIKKIGGLNSIAMITFHVNYYISGVLPVFDGGELTIRDKYSWDMEPMESQADWDRLKQSILNNAGTFASKVEAMSDAQMDENFVDPKYGSYFRNIEGVIEHSYYHMGQIPLIKKLLKARDV